SARRLPERESPRSPRRSPRCRPNWCWSCGAACSRPTVVSGWNRSVGVGPEPLSPPRRSVPSQSMSAPNGHSSPGRIAPLKLRYEPQLSGLRDSDTAKAAGLALAMIANNVIALGSTVVFARLLSDYASLAALISYFLILSVAGQAMQV